MFKKNPVTTLQMALHGITMLYRFFFAQKP